MRQTLANIVMPQGAAHVFRGFTFYTKWLKLGRFYKQECQKYFFIIFRLLCKNDCFVLERGTHWLRALVLAENPSLDPSTHLVVHHHL